MKSKDFEICTPFLGVGDPLTPPISWINSIGVGGREGDGVGGKPKAPLAVRKSRCVLSKAQKQSQCTCRDKTVVGNSLTPLVALLVCPSGTIHPEVDRHEFTWSDKCCL